MTKRDFFRIIIKLFGLFSLITTIFELIPVNLSYAVSMNGFEPYLILWTIILVVIAIAFFTFILFKTDKIIDILKLDRGFDEEKIHFENFNSTNIVKLAAILIGGMMIINSFPEFLNHAYHAFKSSVGANLFYDETYNEKQYFNWILSGINLIIGYLLLTNYKKITNSLLKN